MIVPAGTRVGLMFAAANRRSALRAEPEAYKIGRDLKHSLGFGYGIHALSAGRWALMVEADAIQGRWSARSSASNWPARSSPG